MKSLLLAVQFLTIIPVSVKGEVTQADVARSAAFFPLAGALQGVIAALAALIALRLFPPTITGGLVLCVLTVVNGGFHLDALADTFDAIAVKSTGDGAQDRQKRLSVMKDSATGAIGVTAIVMALLLKYLFIRRPLRELRHLERGVSPLPDARFFKMGSHARPVPRSSRKLRRARQDFHRRDGRTDVPPVVAPARHRHTGGHVALSRHSP